MLTLLLEEDLSEEAAAATRLVPSEQGGLQDMMRGRWRGPLKGSQSKE